MRYLLLVSALLLAGCSASSTVATAPAATTEAAPPAATAEATTTQATPAATAEAAASATAVAPRPASDDWSGGVAVLVELRAPTGWIVDGQFRNEYDEPSMHWKLLLHLDTEAQYAYGAADGVAEPGDAGCVQMLQQGNMAYGRDSFDGIDEIENLGWTLSDEVVAVGDITQIFPTTTLLDTLAIEYTPGQAQVVVASLERDQFDLARAAVGSIGGITTQFDTAELTATLDDQGVVVAFVLAAEFLGDEEFYVDSDFYLDPEEDELEETTARESRSYRYEMHRQPLDASQPRVTPETSMADAGGCAAPSAAVPGVWILRDASVADGSEYMTVEFTADGTIRATAACQSFDGSFRFGFAQLLDVDVVITQDECDPDGYYRQFLDVLRSTPDVALYDNDLIVHTETAWMLLEPA